MQFWLLTAARDDDLILRASRYVTRACIHVLNRHRGTITAIVSNYATLGAKSAPRGLPRRLAGAFGGFRRTAGARSPGDRLLLGLEGGV